MPRALTIPILLLSILAFNASAGDATQIFPEPWAGIYKECGARAFATREPAADETVIDRVPFIIEKPGKYILTGDLKAEASAIAIMSDDVSLDLNGHTITYGAGVKDVATPIMNYTPKRAKGNAGHSAIIAHSRPDYTEDFKFTRRLEEDGKTKRYAKIRIFNGRIVAGSGAGLHYSNALDISGTDDSELFDLVVELGTPDSFGVCAGKKAKIHHVTVKHRGTHVTDRHQQLACISTREDCDIYNCLVDGGPQAGIKAGSNSKIHENTVMQKTTVTNGYGIAGYNQANLEIFRNIVVPANGRGIHCHGDGWKVYENYVEVREVGNPEFKKLQAHGIKLEKAKSTEVYANLVGAITTATGDATPLNMDFAADAANNIHDNVFIAIRNKDREAVPVYYVNADCPTTTIANNTFVTNDRCLKSTLMGGKSVTFKRCSFFALDAAAPPLFYDNETRKQEPSFTTFIDCRFDAATNPRKFSWAGQASWSSKGGYNVGWTAAFVVTERGTPAAAAEITIKNAQQKAVTLKTNERGEASCELFEFKAVFDEKQGRIAECGPYTVTIEGNGKRREFVLQPKAPVEASVDLAGGLDLILNTPAINVAVGENISYPLMKAGDEQAFSVSRGALPEGLRIEGDRIVGTPTVAGIARFDIQSGSASKAVCINVAAARPDAQAMIQRLLSEGKK